MRAAACCCCCCCCKRCLARQLRARQADSVGEPRWAAQRCVATGNVRPAVAAAGGVGGSGVHAGTHRPCQALHAGLGVCGASDAEVINAVWVCLVGAFVDQGGVGKVEGLPKQAEHIHCLLTLTRPTPVMNSLATLIAQRLLIAQPLSPVSISAAGSTHRWVGPLDPLLLRAAAVDCCCAVVVAAAARQQAISAASATINTTCVQP